MKIFFYELGKIFGNVKVLAFILGVTLMNITFLIYNEYHGEISPAAYNAVWQDLCAMEDSEKSDFLEEKLQSLRDYDFFEEAELVLDYEDNSYGEYNLISYVKNEVDSCLSYGDYLNSVNESAKTLIEIPIFADKDSFDYKNIMKTREDFQHLEGKVLSLQSSKGILTAVNFGFTDIFALVLIILFNVVLISREKELEQINLFRTSEKGGMSLALSKLAAVFAADIAAVIFLYGGSAAAGYFLYGFGDLNRDIQSVYGFFDCSLDMTAGEFLIYFFLIKILVCLAFSALCFFLSAITHGSILNIVFTAIITAAEGALYFFIQPSSIFAPLRQLNIFAAADSGRVLGKYLNINIFGTPFFALPVSIAIAAAITVVFSVLGVFFFCGLRQSPRQKISLSLPFGKHTSLFLHELNKTFIGGKALPITVMLVLFVIFTYVPKRISYNSTSDFIYTKYVSSLQGEVTEEKLEYIDEELENAYFNFNETSGDRIEALERLKSHALYLWEKGGLLFNEKGFDMLTGGGESKQNDRFTACAMAVIITVIAGFIYCEEYKTGAFRLLRASEKGRGKTFLFKLLTASIAAFIVLLIFNGTNIYNVLSAYGTEFIFAPALSIERLEFAGKIQIFWYLVLMELGRLIALVLQSSMIFFMSSRLKSYSLTAVGGIVIFGVPPIIAAAGFTYMDYFLLNPMLIGNVF